MIPRVPQCSQLPALMKEMTRSGSGEKSVRRKSGICWPWGWAWVRMAGMPGLASPLVERKHRGTK